MTTRILVLSEDSGSQGTPTAQALLHKALVQLVPNIDSRKVSIEPQPSDTRALHALRGNRWKERNSPERIRLVNEVAARLMSGTVVVFHVDSDTRWSDRKRSENRRQFEKLIRIAIQSMLCGMGAPFPQDRAKPFVPLSPEKARAATDRLIVMHPCYSIESWLYQATEAVCGLCANVHDSEVHQKQIREWGQKRGLLDEIMRPKDDVLGACVSDRHNEDLARHFPADEVSTVKASWSEFLEQLKQLSELRDNLAK